MPNDDLLRLSSCRALLDSANIQSPILPVKATHTTHIVTVIRKLVSCETVFGRIRHGVVCIGEGVSVFAFPAVWTAPPGEEEADVFVAGGVGAGQPCVAFDAAPGLRFYFAVQIEKEQVVSWSEDESFMRISRTWNNCPLGHHLPICCTRYLKTR